MASSKVIGNSAEATALVYLQQQGLTLVQANFYSRFGEIDLIMREKSSGDYVFVEVKQRRAGLDTAIASISPAKQAKLLKTAKYFLLKHGVEVNCRFDALVLDAAGQLSWLKNIILL